MKSVYDISLNVIRNFAFKSAWTARENSGAKHKEKETSSTERSRKLHKPRVPTQEERDSGNDTSMEKVTRNVDVSVCAVAGIKSE